MKEVYILSIIDHINGKLLHQEVFNEIPVFSPQETGVDPSRDHVIVTVANVNGGDSAQLYWDRGKWRS